MPLYEYQCDACGQRFEVIQKFSDPPVETCTSCGKGPVVRLFSSPAIQFKGTGWYITDYARKGQSDSTSSGKKDGAAGGAAKTDTKSDSAAKSESASTSDTSAGAKSAPKTGGD
jgi:putative FmdB family regulatory protein